MTNVLFNSGFIGFLIWVLLFAVSTAALAIAIRCMWVLRKSIFATAEFEEKLIPFLFLAFALMVSVLPFRVQAALPKALPASPTKFLTGACLTWSEDLWITAEAGGVYRLSGQEKNPKWEDMRKQPGFPKTDNCTAVCEDSQGRIWVGTANAGVQVFYKGQWKRYDRDTVLGGSHVHALASTSTGLTAVAHEQGVSLYNSHDDSWRDFTVLNGLPAGGVRDICFGSGDNLHCAMESGGYVRIDVRGTGRSAQRLIAPETWGKNRAVFYPLTTTGQGLCSNFCNGITVGSLGQICIASLNGISYSTTGGFQYLQGSDLKAKMDGAARKELISNELKLFKASASALKESYVNYVLYGKNGLWIGYRGKGIELRDSTNPQRIKEIKDMPKIKRPVRAVVEMPDGRVVCATYGAGLVEVCRGIAFAAPSRRKTAIANHPSYKRNDPVSVLQEIRKRDSQAKPMPKYWARFIGEDWCTMGDWCGHYGARRNVLCAANAPTGDSGMSNDSITINGGIGPHRQKGDSMRRWVEWVKADQNRNVLFKMEYCYRTEAEWDDHGETYPRTFEGPDLWITLILNPEAVWRLALYFYNPNGRTNDNHERDYVLEVYSSEQGESLNKCMSKKPLCTARVSDFASNGVYKVFALHGAGCYRVRILRNGSLNTILNGIFLDHLYEPQDISKAPETPFIKEQGRFHAPRWYDCGTDKLTGLATEYAKRYLAASETAVGIATLPLLRLEFYRHVRTRVPSNKILAERLRWDLSYECVDSDYDFNGDLFNFLNGVSKEPLTNSYYICYRDEVLPWSFYGSLAEKHGEMLKRIISAVNQDMPTNILLYGAPGTGKTSFAKTLATELKRNCYMISQSIRGSDGPSRNLPPFSSGRRKPRVEHRFASLQVCAEQVDPADSIIIVDEADDMLRSQISFFAFLGGGSGITGDKGLLNSVLDSVRVPTIWITNTPAEALDESSRRRFDYSIRFDPLNAAQRLAIWRNNVAKMKLEHLVDDAMQNKFASIYPVSAGGITLTLQNLVKLSPRPDEVESLVKKLMAPHCELLNISQADDRLLPAQDYSLEGLNIKGSLSLDRIVDAIRNFQQGSDGAIDRPRMNLLLSGAPGTGKTEFVKYLGSVLNTKVVVKMGSDLLNMYVGGTEQNIRRAFDEAEAEKAILFLDEIDGLVQSRERAMRSWEVTQVNELLHRMENFNGVMIGATNFSANLDAAILRRFTFKLEFDYLDEVGKKLFFERMFRTTLTPEEYHELAQIPMLAPGDFRTVRQSFFYLGGQVSTRDYIAALARESDAKSANSFAPKSKIGF